MTNKIILKGTWELILRNINTGEIISQDTFHNVIVNDGKERVARLINGVSSTYFQYIAIGQGATVESATDAALEGEVKRALATLSYEASYKAKFNYIFTFASGESYNITEAGIFDSASSGTMLNRFTFPVKAVDELTTLEITIKIQVA